MMGVMDDDDDPNMTDRFFFVSRFLFWRKRAQQKLRGEGDTREEE